jgi:hypothetical protein
MTVINGVPETTKRRGSKLGCAGLISIPLLVIILLGVLTFKQCSPPAPGSLDAQAQAWAKAVDASDPLLYRVKETVYAHGTKDDHVAIDTTISRNEPLTFDILKRVYNAVLASTQEKWKGEKVVVTFHHATLVAGGIFTLMDVNKVFADAGFPYNIDWAGRGVSWEADTLNIIPNPALGGFPGTAEANGAPDTMDSQRQAWSDAAVASNPNVTSALVDTIYTDDKGSFAETKVTLRAGTNLTLDLMRNMGNAMEVATRDKWTGTVITVQFFSANDPNNALPVSKAFVDAGVPDPNASNPKETRITMTMDTSKQASPQATAN